MMPIEMSGCFVVARVIRDLISNLQVSCLSPKDVLLSDHGTVKYY
jgi:hypothetical protein